MEKRISFFNFQSVKSVAKAIDPHQKTLLTLRKKALSLKEEYAEKQAKLKQEMEEKAGRIKQEFDACEAQINALEAGILQVTGFHVADLVKKVIEPTGKTDPKTGKPLKVTKYLPTDIVTYDENAKEYVITIPDDTDNTSTAEPECPVHEETAGSDFDKDAAISEEYARAMSESEVSDEPSNGQKPESEMPWD